MAKNARKFGRSGAADDPRLAPSGDHGDSLHHYHPEAVPGEDVIRPPGGMGLAAGAGWRRGGPASFHCAGWDQPPGVAGPSPACPCG